MNTTHEKPLFILVDDDAVNNSISRLTITNTVDAEVISFTDSFAGLNFVVNDFAATFQRPAILLLNLNMPFINGWDFLKQYAKVDDRVKQLLKIFILSSSLNPADRARSDEHELVSGYLTKPLTAEVVLSLVNR